MKLINSSLYMHKENDFNGFPSEGRAGERGRICEQTTKTKLVTATQRK